MSDRQLSSDSLSEKVRTVGRSGYKLTDAAYHRHWLARVMRKIVIDANGCWRWQGFKGDTGYAQTGYRGHAMNGHRAMYMIHFGVKLATEQYVLHRCDVRDCINPDHLWIGTVRSAVSSLAGSGRPRRRCDAVCHVRTATKRTITPNEARL